MNSDCFSSSDVEISNTSCFRERQQTNQEVTCTISGCLGRACRSPVTASICLKISPRSSTGRARVRLQVNGESDQRQISLSNLWSAPFSTRRLPFSHLHFGTLNKTTSNNKKKGVSVASLTFRCAERSAPCSCALLTLWALGL